MSSKALPAILGGTPERSRPFIVEPMIDENEERLVLAAIREKNFSRYIGSHSPDLETSLRLPSAEAAAIEADWHFLGGPNVRAFAAEFAAAFDVPFAVPVSSATTGLSIALGAAGIAPGDEVILPAISFSATASAILLFNAIPVFADVDPLSFCLNPAAVEAAVTPATKAILPVHLLGNLADMDALLDIAERHGLMVIEDAAQAPGAHWRDARAGTLGNAGVFSFQQSKNIMTGEGGMIVTRDAEIARRARLILNHGEVAFDDAASARDLANIIGLNARLPELSAALGRATFRPYLTDDMTGAQIGGALKNVMAIAAGIAIGRGLGENARAAIMTRGFAEMVRLALAKGARLETLAGLSGLGDLVLTCSSVQSRNFSLGVALGEGTPLADILGARESVAEGVTSAPAMVALGKKLAIDLPIAEAVDAVLHQGADISETIAALLSRPFRPEF